jgi:hypothetical protein
MDFYRKLQHEFVQLFMFIFRKSILIDKSIMDKNCMVEYPPVTCELTEQDSAALLRNAT